jgi:hypothetical protein
MPAYIVFSDAPLRDVAVKVLAGRRSLLASQE